jgi:hypothetical protein
MEPFLQHDPATPNARLPCCEYSLPIPLTAGSKHMARLMRIAVVAGRMFAWSRACLHIGQVCDERLHDKLII